MILLKNYPALGKPEPGEIFIRGGLAIIQRGKTEATEIKKVRRGEDRRQYRRGKADAIRIKGPQRGEDQRQYRREKAEAIQIKGPQGDENGDAEAMEIKGQ